MSQKLYIFFNVVLLTIIIIVHDSRQTVSTINNHIIINIIIT